MSLGKALRSQLFITIAHFQVAALEIKNVLRTTVDPWRTEKVIDPTGGGGLALSV